MGRFSCLADLSSVIDQEVGKTAPSLSGKDLSNILFNLIRVLVIRDPQPQGEPLDVRVHHYTGDIKGRAQDNIGRFPADSGKFYHLFHGGRDLSFIKIQ